MSRAPKKFPTFFRGLICGCAAVFLVIGLAPTDVEDEAVKLESNATPASSSRRAAQVLNLLEKKNLEGLPINQVNYYPAADARRTVIFIPQYHRNPTSGAKDQINDSAEKTQKQIYQIVSFLNNQYDLGLVMVEGELVGEVSQEKIAKLAGQIKQENGLNREIILQGAPQVLKAEGKNLKLFGAENEDTLKESRALVRDYVYLQKIAPRDRFSNLFLELNDLGIQNPYQNMMKEVEQEMEKVVVEKRNRETGQNLARLLEQENRNTAILVFGAGHEKGLIRELNNQGLSVIVLTPEEVAIRSAQ